MLIEEMGIITNKIVKHYKEDFLNDDVNVLESPKGQYYIWIVRTAGTYLIPKSDLKENIIYEFYLNLYETAKNKKHYNLKFFEIDTVNQKMKNIRKPRKYYESIN